MNDYVIEQTSSTSGAIIRAGLLGAFAGLLLMTPPNVAEGSSSDVSLPKPSIKIESHSKTYGRYSNLFTGEYEYSYLIFEDEIASLYEQFLARQKPLERTLAQVLHDNIWDLAVRS